MVLVDKVVPTNRGRDPRRGQAGGNGLDETEGERGRQDGK
jgi:hypothetical protein